MKNVDIEENCWNRKMSKLEKVYILNCDSIKRLSDHILRQNLRVPTDFVPIKRLILYEHFKRRTLHNSMISKL